MKDDLAIRPPTASRPSPSRQNFETDPRPRSRRPGLLRVPRRPDGPQQRGPDQDLQPLPRPRRTLARHPQAPRAARRDGPGRPRRLRLAPTSPSRPPASSCSTTRRTKTTRRSNGGRRRKKPWRYRWPDDFRDEVLARLLELNRQRAEEERLRGNGAENSGKKPKGKTTRGKKKPTNDDQLNMFSLSSSKTGVSEDGTS